GVRRGRPAGRRGRLRAGLPGLAQHPAGDRRHAAADRRRRAGRLGPAGHQLYAAGHRDGLHGLHHDARLHGPAEHRGALQGQHARQRRLPPADRQHLRAPRHQRRGPRGRRGGHCPTTPCTARPGPSTRRPASRPCCQDGSGEEEDGVKFFNVTTACPGADEAPDLAEAEEVMRQALPLAEALEEVAVDFVAPLVVLFGDGWTRCFYSRQWQCRVAALMHLSASIAQRIEQLSGSDGSSSSALGELLDGAMRAIHEGLGDQNVRVYAEACAAVTNAVPAFCGTVDDRLLVAHLAPLLRQLCARMADTKDRGSRRQALLRLLRPPVGNIVSPLALAMLVLRHLVPA
ncbi:unnamed protein product, partial [Prorocentrum cordatum]